MISWKKIHQWMVKALEEPFFRAEMHRVEMYLPDNEEVQLQLIKGGLEKRVTGINSPVESEAIRRLAGDLEASIKRM